MEFVISIIPTTAITTKAITSDILIISDFFIAFSILLVNAKRSPLIRRASVALGGIMKDIKIILLQ